jgi:hypothetical protein
MDFLFSKDMRKLNIKWNSEKLLSISAMSISFLTLIIFIYQTNLISKQNYISILPYLSISTTENRAEHTFEFNLENHGVGPAIIESVTMLHKGQRYNLNDYNNEMYRFLVSKAPELDSIKNSSSSTLDNGMAIPVNTTFNLFKVFESTAEYRIITSRFNRLLEEGLDYEIIYRSILDERWMIHKGSQGPKKLD